MAKNEDHLKILEQGVDVWNEWYKDVLLSFRPDLSLAKLNNRNLASIKLPFVDLVGADLSGADLREADLRANLTDANLSGANLAGAYFDGARLVNANLSHCNLIRANFVHAKLQGANLHRAKLQHAKLTGAKLEGANLSAANLEQADLNYANCQQANLSGVILANASLSHANLYQADLRIADLHDANLTETFLAYALLNDVNFSGATIIGCEIYGISAWNLNLDRAVQSDLRITRPTFYHEPEEPTITVDNLEVAQFIYLLIHYQKIRDIIDTVSSKVVLILGRFTPERKVVLDAIRDSLRVYDYVPVLFDFTKPFNRDLTETISTLAHISRFVIADITDAKSIPQELQRIVPELPSVPVKPILLKTSTEYGMFEHFRRYPWVLEPYIYESVEEVVLKIQCGFGHKVKLVYYWNQQLTRTIRSLNEILFGQNVRISYNFRA